MPKEKFIDAHATSALHFDICIPIPKSAERTGAQLSECKGTHGLLKGHREGHGHTSIVFCVTLCLEKSEMILLCSWNRNSLRAASLSSSLKCLSQSNANVSPAVGSRCYMHQHYLG